MEIIEELKRIFSADNDDVIIEQYNISDGSFDLMDKLEKSICKENEGNVTYKNETEKSIFVLNYEKFIESLPAEKRKGIKHCDFLVSESDSFFICNELSMGADINSKWPKAWKQLQQTIQILNKSDKLKELFSTLTNKFCVLSTRREKITTPLGIADAFNISYELIKNVQERLWYPINQLGFKVFESDYVIYKNDKSIQFLKSV